MEKQLYLPEYKFVETNMQSEIERREELFEAIESSKICCGKVKYCHPNADYLLVDLGFGITGWISRKNISINRIYSIAHSLVGQVAIFKVEKYDEDKDSFILNRSAVQLEAKKWQLQNFAKGDIIVAIVKEVLCKGIIVDIGGGFETFIPPCGLVNAFIKDFNTVFYKGQEINLLVEGFDEEYHGWKLNYVDCPQMGLTINSTYAVCVDKYKEKKSWYCTFITSQIKGIIIVKNNLLTEEGDIEKATIIGFKKGIPLLKAI